MSNIDLTMLRQMRSGRVGNYVIPGLTSWVIGAKHDGGCVRMFYCEREHQEPITPHSHRFDFQCLVLRGRVTNRKWTFVYGQRGDLFAKSALVFSDMGKYEKRAPVVGRYEFADEVFKEGEWYSMKAHEIHSIFFGAQTEVLFFEGPSTTDTSVILEPYVDNEVIPTFEVRPWMFKKEGSAAA